MVSAPPAPELHTGRSGWQRDWLDITCSRDLRCVYHNLAPAAVSIVPSKRNTLGNARCASTPGWPLTVACGARACDPRVWKEELALGRTSSNTPLSLTDAGLGLIIMQSRAAQHLPGHDTWIRSEVFWKFKLGIGGQSFDLRVWFMHCLANCLCKLQHQLGVSLTQSSHLE
jgi:hypothetical protein